MTAVKRNEIQKKEYPQEEGIWSYIGKKMKEKRHWEKYEMKLNVCPNYTTNLS